MSDEDQSAQVPPGIDADDGLAFYWKKPLHLVASVPAEKFSDEDAERHAIYSLLTMALIAGYWNGNKSGAVGTYPWRSGQMIDHGRYRGDSRSDRYMGHNIACIAVDEDGRIIDFEFNHNETYNSSVEHAEARLIRRIFSLNQIADHWQVHAIGNAGAFIPYGNVFNGVTVYTSLESCAQCSGIMTLASCLRVVYLQNDPGQNRVGNILYNLTRPQGSGVTKASSFSSGGKSKRTPATKYWAPLPVDADNFEFKYKKRLDEAYLDYAKRVKEDQDLYFFRPLDWKTEEDINRSSSITSFLCTDVAMKIFNEAAHELTSLQLKHGCHRPQRSDGARDQVLCNEDVLEQAKRFLHHAIEHARRGTPHR